MARDGDREDYQTEQLLDVLERIARALEQLVRVTAAQSHD